jgi:murein DD-endopeptidase MepM/ murein hydrolase activator NlpD
MNGLRHFRSIHSRAASVLVAALVVLAGCDDGIPLFEPPPPRSAHERYENGLERAGLDSTALGRDWVAAAAAAISQPLEVALPFREAGYFSASEARAVGYAVRLRAGQELSVIAEPEGAPYAIFLDLFRQTGDTAEPLDLVASIDSVGGPAGSRLTHEARRDGVYVLRLQPELLRSGGFTLTLSTEPTLAFPVAGRDSRAVKSFFGADRDAGARRHHGIDIFAPRGTPVIAATRGTVRSTRPNNLGGNVIWLSDYERGQTLYYAHLDRHIVSPGQQVEIGDTLGFVGNTGNARSTRSRSSIDRRRRPHASRPIRRSWDHSHGRAMRRASWPHRSRTPPSSRRSRGRHCFASTPPLETGSASGFRTARRATSPRGSSSPRSGPCDAPTSRPARRSATDQPQTRR